MEVDPKLLDEVLEGANRRYDKNYEEAEAVLSPCHQIHRTRNKTELLRTRTKYNKSIAA
jgi:hypothetical protein